MPARRLLLAAPLALAAVAPAADPPPKPDPLVLVQKGTLPVIVSAPHGGRLPIPDVPERVGAGVRLFATVRDVNTAELADRFAADLERVTGGTAWLVAARFDRKYLDVNRPPDGAYEDDRAKPVYDAYHAALAAACKAVKEKHRAGLLLDLHGQGAFPNAVCRGTRDGKTVGLLVERHGRAALTGKHGVLGRLERAGYEVLPPAGRPAAKEEPAFAGGHIVDTYGSHTGYAIDAIQVEFGSYLRDRAALSKTAADLADAVAAFHAEYLAK
ncbi:MAG: N-formylglutamate amidohydrolase [Gemmataceae bacterium]|nr:N-formylglutamate amidohydrolase [Gemmataceae bacterium]